MKKNQLLLMLVLLSNFFVFSQVNPLGINTNLEIIQPGNHPEKCGFDGIHRQLIQDPAYLQKEQQFNQFVRNFVPSKTAAAYKIPVVIHVMETGGVLTTITDEQIQYAIQTLNERMRKTTGGLGDGGGVDVTIEYALAVRDPNGNCTNGITRVDMSGDATYMASGVRRNTGSGITDAALKAYVQWDPTEYYNMWLISEIDNNGGGSGTQGYAYFASSHGSSVDGAVMLVNNLLDDNGTTLIHELGHSLNLYHTFEGDRDIDGNTYYDDCPADITGGACGSNVGDCCADIPAHSRSMDITDASPTGSDLYFDCDNTDNNTCVGGTTHQDHIHNYMDYSSDDCQNEFTDNQKTRMIAALTTTRSSFLESNGNMALVPVSAPTVEFTVSKSILCGTGQTVQFYDKSTCSPNTFMAETAWTGITYAWTFTNNAGTTYTSTLQNPLITFNATGTFDAQLVLTNSAGTSTLNKQGAVLVSVAPTAACTPSSNNNGNFNQTINNVTFNTINNSTSTLTNTAYTNNACTINTVVSAGGTYNLSVTLKSGGSGREFMEAYIDYNNNGNFTDDGGAVLTGSTPTTNTSTVVSGNVTIPGGATQNTLLRMRIIGETFAFPTANNKICTNNYQIGEVEDYSIFVSNKVASVSIAATPSSTLLYGVNTTFTATPVNGGAAPTYKWYKNGTLIAGATSATYSSTTLVDDDEIYCVMTSNLAGVIASPATSNTIALTVTGAPLSDFSADKVEGCTTTSFNFTDESLLAPTSWSWTFAGGTPATSTAQNPSVTFASAGTHTVTLTATNALGTGTTETKTAYITTYATTAGYCAITTRTTSFNDIGILNVTVNTINNTSAYNDAVYVNNFCTKNTTLAQGSTYSLSMTGSTSNNQWFAAYIDYNNDGDFGEANEVIYPVTGGISGTRSGNFTIPAGVVTSQLLRMRVITDFGSTTGAGPCKATLAYGQSEDYGVIITPCAPAITANPVNATNICNFYDASFSVTADRATGYQWEVSTNGGGNWSNVSNGGIYSGATTATLTLDELTIANNNYQYRCVVSGSCAPTATSTAATLTVKAAVNIPGTLSTTAIGQSTATVNWGTVSGTNMRIALRKVGTTSWHIKEAAYADSYVLTGDFSTDANYEWKVKVQDNGCWGEWSAIETFYVCETAAAPTALVSSNVFTNKVTLSWTSPGANEIKVGLRKLGTSTWYTQNTAFTESYVYHADFSKNSTYEWRVRVRCGSEWGPWSTTSQFTTGSAAGMILYDGDVIGLDQAELLIEVNPNPSAGDFTIQSSREGDYHIVNELGQLIQVVKISKESNFKADVKGLDQGVYFITGIIQGETITKKIIIH